MKKKIEGGTLCGHEKKFSKKIFKMRFLNSVRVPKNVKGWTLCDFGNSLCCKKSKQKKGGPFGAIQKVSKSLIVPKKSGAMGFFEVLGVCFVFPFHFGRASEVGVVEV